MKKALIISGIMAGMLMAAQNSTVTNVLNKLGKRFPGYKGVSIVQQIPDKKLGVDLGIAEVNIGVKKNYLLYMYYPKAKAVQLLQPSQLKILTDNPKTHYLYLDKPIKQTLIKYIQLRRKEFLREIKMRKQAIFSMKKGKNAVIFLSKNPNKPTKVIFLDPNCPFCRMKMKHFNFQRALKKYNIVFVLMPITTIHPHSFALSENITAEIKPNMSWKQKVEIIRKNMHPVMYNKFKRIKNKQAAKKVQNNIEKFENSGLIPGTPTIVILSPKESQKLFNNFK